MVLYDPYSDEVLTNPHPVYKRLRDEAPVYHLESYDAWALSRFDDVWNASMDADHYTTTRGTTPAHLLTKVQPVTPMLNLMDPPAHTDLRTQVRKFLQPAAARRLEAEIRQLAETCVDEIRERGEGDVLADLAQKVATTAACRAVGIPLEDAPLLNDLVFRFMARDPEIDGMTPDGLAAMGELFGYFAELGQKREKSGLVEEDIVNTIVSYRPEGRPLSPEELGSHLSLFIIGGAETFPKVLANCLYRLHEHPDQRAEMVADQSLIPEAFWEGCRYDMPTQFLCRVVKKDHELHGHKLREGQPVLFLYTAANRDEREFENPDVFDIKRKAPRILSFGHGIHACIGIHTAKMEARVCLETIADRIPEYGVDMDRSERNSTEFVQGFAKLTLLV
jgi:cytochrome P450